MRLTDPFATRGSTHRGRLIRWEGHTLVELESPELRVEVSLSRGAEIVRLYDKTSDTELLWRGHEDIFRNRVAPSSRVLDEGNFLDHFSGGWQTILPNAQFPVDYLGAALGAHGEAALLPWDFYIVEDAPAVLSVAFFVTLRRLPLSLRRTLTLTGGVIHLAEQLINLSDHPIHYQLGHHISLSGSALPQGTEIILPELSTVTVPVTSSPSDRYSPGETAWPTVLDSQRMAVDASILPEDDGSDGQLIIGPMAEAAVGLRAPSGLTLDFSWDSMSLPYCWIWQVFRGHPTWPLWGQHRLITVEPFSSPVRSLTDEIEMHTAPLLGPRGETRAWVQLSVSSERRRVS